MQRQRSSPYYVYSPTVGIHRMEPLVMRRNSYTKLAKSRKFAVGDAPTPKRNNSPLRNPNHLYLKHLLEPLHDEFSALEVKLATLEKLWAEAAVPLDYYSNFLNTLKRKPSRRYQFQLVLKEVQLLRDRHHYPYFQIAETVRARENVLGLIIPYFEQMHGDNQLLLEELNVLARAMQADVLVHYAKETDEYQNVSQQPTADVPTSKLSLVIKHILLYRQLTTKAIRLIWDWGCYLRREGFIGPAQFLHKGVDYYEKISEQDSLMVSRCSQLFDRHPYCLVKKDHEKDYFGLLWRKLKPNPTEATEILECIEILAVHSSAVLKLQLAEAYNRDVDTERTEKISPPRGKSLVERLYGSQVKLSLPTNYLQRKHPVYLYNPERDSQPFRIEYVRHQKSMLVEAPKYYDLLGRANAQAKLEMLDDLNSKLQHRQQRASEVTMREKDYDKAIKLKFVESQPEQHIRDDPDYHNQDKVMTEVFIAPSQQELTFLYVQMYEDRVLDFLENLFLERYRNQRQLDHILRKVLSHRDCTIIKVTDEERPGRDKLVSLVVGMYQTLANGKLEFEILYLLLFNGMRKETVLQQLTSYLQQYNKYSSLAIKTNRQYNSGLNVLPVPMARYQQSCQLSINVSFRALKKHKQELKEICREYSHLRRLYKSRNEYSNKYLTYDEDSETYQLVYQCKFNIVSAVKMVSDERGTVTPYLKIRMDKVVKLILGAHRSIQAYKLIQFGVKEVMQMVFTDDGKSTLDDFDEELLEDCYEQPPVTNLEVLLPVLTVKMKYLGSESEKLLFRETIKLSDKGVAPLSLIRSKAKYLDRPSDFLLIPERFMLRVLNREGYVLFSRSF